MAVRRLSTSMARVLKSARRPRKNKTNMTSLFRNIPPPKKNFINLLLKLIVQKVSVGQTFMRADNVKLHRLQVTIDLHKSKLYVKTKQKFSKDIDPSCSKVD